MTNRTAVVILAAALLATIAPPERSAAYTITVEAEGYHSSQNIAMTPIQQYMLTGCSSGFVLYGLDYPGEWTGYSMSVSQHGTFSARLVAKGYAGFENHVRLEVTPAGGGTTQTGTFVLTGDGLG